MVSFIIFVMEEGVQNTLLCLSVMSVNVSWIFCAFINDFRCSEVGFFESIMTPAERAGILYTHGDQPWWALRVFYHLYVREQLGIIFYKVQMIINMREREGETPHDPKTMLFYFQYVLKKFYISCVIARRQRT